MGTNFPLALQAVSGRDAGLKYLMWPFWFFITRLLPSCLSQASPMLTGDNSEARGHQECKIQIISFCNTNLLIQCWQKACNLLNTRSSSSNLCPLPWQLQISHGTLLTDHWHYQSLQTFKSKFCFPQEITWLKKGLTQGNSMPGAIQVRLIAIVSFSGFASHFFSAKWNYQTVSVKNPQVFILSREAQ